METKGVMKPFVAVLEPLYRGVIEESDPPVVVLRKKVLLTTNFLYAATATLAAVTRPDASNPSFWLASCFVLWTVACFAFVSITKQVGDEVIFINATGLSILTLAYDFHSIVNSIERAWPLVILSVDLLLATEVDRRATTVQIALLTGWLCLTSAEEAYRFGFFDMVPSWRSEELQRHNCGCPQPPCRRNLGYSVATMLLASTVFYADFFITRGFATAVSSEKAKMVKAVAVAEQLAKWLAEFDLEAAEEGLQEMGDALPEKLSGAFSDILKNLTSYRPFLPDALFQNLNLTRPTTPDTPPPGTVSGHAALVFTDIEGSTSLWETCPEGMRRGLKQHNRVLRECVEQYGGYEVKTIGDAFMVAFEEAGDAVRFGLAVQEALHAANWPAALLQTPQCRREGNVWGGLRVRVGVHYGPVEVELNEVLNRYDYFGCTVNKAARVEGRCISGSIAVTSEALKEAPHIGELEAVVVPAGQVALRGVKSGATLSLLIPASLSRRRPDVEARLALCDQWKPTPATPVKADDVVSISASSVVGSSAAGGSKEHFQYKTDATVATARIHCSADSACDGVKVQADFNEKLAAVLQCLDRTEGAVVGVLSECVVVGWNTTRRLPIHTSNALRFSGLLDSCLSPASRVTLGVAVGPALCGHVGTGFQKFVTVIGSCVAFSRVLAETAWADLQCFCLFASLNAGKGGTRQAVLERVMRPVINYYADSALAPSTPTAVAYEVACKKLLDPSVFLADEGCEDDDEEAGGAEEWGWTAPYRSAFFQRDIVSIVPHIRDDPILERVVLFLQNPKPPCIVVDES